MWPAGIRKAIVIRDRRCQFPGCDRPPQWCDIDHVIPVAQQGPTSLSNGILPVSRAPPRNVAGRLVADSAQGRHGRVDHADGRVHLDRSPGHTRDLADQLTATAAARTGPAPTPPPPPPPRHDTVDAAREHAPRYRTGRLPRDDQAGRPPSDRDVARTGRLCLVDAAA